MREKRRMVTVLVGIMILLLAVVGCSKNKSNSYVMKLAKKNKIYQSPIYSELLDHMENLFPGYKNQLPGSKDSMLFVGNESVAPIENVKVQYNDQGELTSISGDNKDGKTFIWNIKHCDKDGINRIDGMFMEKELGQYSAILNVELVFNAKKKVLYSTIDYCKDSLYNVKMIVSGVKSGDKFSNSEFYVSVMFSDGKVICDTISPSTFADNGLLEKIKQHIATMGLPPAELDFLQPQFLAPGMIVGIKELEMIENQPYKNIDWQAIYDALGSMMADTFGLLITGVYIALSGIACGI